MEARAGTSTAYFLRLPTLTTYTKYSVTKILSHYNVNFLKSGKFHITMSRSKCLARVMLMIDSVKWNKTYNKRQWTVSKVFRTVAISLQSSSYCEKLL